MENRKQKQAVVKENLICVVIGGGAAGFFGALSCAENYPQHRVILLEKTRQLLSKVRISGGGRCNVTHACFEPAQLVKHYPRGNRELRGPFTIFQPKDTIEWFESRGVKLKVESDGRIFPITDNSESIIDCLTQETKRLGVEVYLEHGIEVIKKENGESFPFRLLLQNGQELHCDRVLLATGSAQKVCLSLREYGHRIIPPVPSLFTFNIPDSPFLDLAGISVSEVAIKLPAFKLEQAGPILLTHWGLSGPAILKLSAWGARQLHDSHYQTTVVINWLPNSGDEELLDGFQKYKSEFGARQVSTESLFHLPKQLWKRLMILAGIEEDLRWSQISHKHMRSMMTALKSTTLNLNGKTTYKQEFVTCGGVSLDEVNFKTMESRKCPGIYFAGEILDIDGVTGGFNFQNAWTTGWIAGRAMGKIGND